MNNLILGSGLIACLAKKLLGPGWSFISFKKSRYYSFDIPLADDFIRCDKDIDTVSAELGLGGPIIIYKRPFSYRGQLTNSTEPIVIDPYVQKVYKGRYIPGELLKTVFSVYDVRALPLYTKLSEQSWDQIQAGAQSKLLGIDLKTRALRLSDGRSIEYERLISTIPLNILYALCGLDASILKARPVCHYRVQSNKVDLEGAEQALVSDLDIEFYKVTKLSDGYIFNTFEAIENPYLYFGKFLGYQLDIVEVLRIDESVPIGEPPDMKIFSDAGIICVGSNAQWDDFMDIASCIKRLINLK
jgi:hypothetical protein